PATAIAVPEIGRTAEATAPGTAVFADLVHRLDHQRVLADALLHRWQLPSFDQFRQLRRLLKTLGKLRRVGDHCWTLQLPNQIAASWSGSASVSCHPSSCR